MCSWIEGVLEGVLEAYSPLHHAQIEGVLEGVLEAYSPLQHAHIEGVLEGVLQAYSPLQHAHIEGVLEGVLGAYSPLQHTQMEGVLEGALGAYSPLHHAQIEGVLEGVKGKCAKGSFSRGEFVWVVRFSFLFRVWEATPIFLGMECSECIGIRDCHNLCRGCRWVCGAASSSGRHLVCLIACLVFNES